MVEEHISNWRKKVKIQFEAVIGTFHKDRLKAFLNKVDYEDRNIKKWQKTQSKNEHLSDSIVNTSKE